MKVIFFNQLPQPALTAHHNIRLTPEHPLLFVHEYSTKQNSNFNSHKLGCSIKGLLDLEWPVLKWESEPVRAEDVLVSFTGSNFAIQLLFWHSSLLFIKPFLFVLILFGDKLHLDKGRKFFTSIVIIEEQHLIWGGSSGLCSGLVGWYSSLSSTSQVSISLSIPVSSGNILDSVPALLSDSASALGSPGGISCHCELGASLRLQHCQYCLNHWNDKEFFPHPVSASPRMSSLSQMTGVKVRAS